MADAPTLSQFTAELRNRNISKPSLYYLEIVPPPIFIGGEFDAAEIDLVNMWCNAAQTPQITIMTQDNFIEAGVRRKYAYDQDYQNLTLSFYVDQEFKVKKFFDQWKQAVVPQKRNFGYPDDYTSDRINLYIIDQSGNNTYKHEYSRIFPKAINSIELSYASGSAVSTFSVDFVFEEVYFSSINRNEIGSSSKPSVNMGFNLGSGVVNQEVSQSLEPVRISFGVGLDG